MKLRKLTLLSITILASLLIGAFAVTVLSAPPVLKLKVKWKPATYTLDSTAPDPWNAEIFFAPPRPLSDVDITSLRLEGTIQPKSPPYLDPSKNGRIIVPFIGDDVVEALLSKLPHYTPGQFIIFLEISGRLKDGKPFKGSGPITLTLPELPPQ